MTKTITLTEAECHALTVRGDVPGVLDGYIGPVRWGQASALWAYVGLIQDCHYAASGDDGRHDAYVGRDCLGDAHQGFFLPLARPEVQAHLVGWLGRGAFCPDFDGKSHAPVPDSPDQPPFCPRCRDTGYLRPPHNRYAWLTPEAHEGLPDWIRMALIWGSVVRMAAGMDPVGMTLAPWVLGAKAMLTPPAVWPASIGPDFFASRHIVYCPDHRSGHYTVMPWNRDREDRYWLSQGFALVDDFPAGPVIRFEVPDAP